MADVDIRRIGFTDLTRGRAFPLNIIFVHGLMGNPEETWKFQIKEPSPKRFKSIFKSSSKQTPNPSTSFFWPQQLLAEDLPDARVWTYGYDADALQGIFTAKNKNSISQHANDLKVKLERTIQGAIIFIAHSLGGVLVKDVLWQSRVCQENTKGIIFLGTPHRGSGLGDYAGIASNLAGMALQDINHKLVRSLEVDSQVLNIINREFIKTITRLRIPIHSFQEGKPISGVKGLHDKVVPDYSSVLDIDPSLETKETINLDHRQMAKCQNRSDEQYDAIIGVVEQYKSRTNMPLTSGPSITSDTYTSVDEATFDGIVESHYTIPYANRQFTGRHGQIKELQDRLLGQDDFQEFAICGLGGIGKTQVALAFCHFVKAHHPEYSIFWVSALSRASFEKDYAEIARKCAISIADKKRTLQNVQQYLESSAAGPWIMIVDNADMKELMLDPQQGLKKYLPEHRKGIRIYTSRDVGLAYDIALAIDTMVVEEMEYHDAKALLTKYLGNKDVLHSEDITTELLVELEFIPLAIVQAASFIKKTHITVTQYLGLMRKTDKDRANLVSEENRQAVRTGTSDAITVTWLISFDRIREEEASALKLLCFLAVIQNRDIPHAILPQESEMDLTQAVGVLRNYSFLVKQDKTDVYDMHRLVHQAIRAWMQGSLVIDRLGEWQVAHLVKIWPSSELKNQLLWQKYLPHAIAALAVSAETPTELRAKLSLLVGRCLRIDGRLQEAVDLLTSCYVWRNEQLYCDDEASLEAHRELAIAYRWSGYEAEAVQILSQLAQREQHLSELGDAPRLQTLYELGMAQLWVGNSKAAIAALKSVVDSLGQSDDNTEGLEALHGLVLAYRSDGQSERAADLLLQNPSIETKLQPRSVGDIHGYLPTHRTNTLGKHLIIPLDLIGKLDWISWRILRQTGDLELRYTLASKILSRSTTEDLHQSPPVDLAAQSIDQFVQTSKKPKSLNLARHRSVAWSDVARVLNHADSNTNESFPDQKDQQISIIQQEALIAKAARICNEFVRLTGHLLAEQYSVSKRSGHSQYLSVGPDDWGIESVLQKPSALLSEQVDLCVKVMEHCWISIAGIHEDLKSQASLSRLDILYNQSLIIKTGLDSVIAARLYLKEGSLLDNPFHVRWKMCLAIEYWQQGYLETAVMHMEAARRSTSQGNPLNADCLKWLQRFETEKTSASVASRTQ